MIKGAYNKIGQYLSETFDFNKSTLSGCIDIIVVEQPDGTLKSSSFHARFGRLKVLNPKEKKVYIIINGVKQQATMNLEPNGQAFFTEYREQKDFRKFSEDVNMSESDYDIQSPSEDEDILTSPRGEMSTQDQLDLEEKQQKDLQKMKEMFNQTSLSPKSNKGIMDSFIKIFKGSKKSEQQLKESKEKNGQNKDQEKINIQQQGEQQVEVSPLKKQEIKDQDNQQEQSQEFNNGSTAKSKPQNKLEIQIDDTQQSQNSIQDEKTQQQQINSQEVLQINQNELSNSKNMIQITSQDELDKVEVNKQHQTEEVKKTQEEQSSNTLQQSNEEIDGDNEDNEEQNEFVLQEQNNEDLDQDEGYDDDIIEMSLCANLINKSNEDDPSEIFEQKKIKFEEFIQDPIKILTNKNLLIRIKNELYTYELGVSILFCQQAFRQELPYETKKKMMKKKTGFFSKFFSKEKQTPLQKPAKSENNSLQNDKLNLADNEKQNKNVIANENNKAQQENTQESQIQKPANKPGIILKKTLSQEGQINLNDNNESQGNIDKALIDEMFSQKKKERKLSEESQQSEFSNSKHMSRRKKYLRPKPTVLKEFNLKYGRNSIAFTVHSEMQGEQTVEGSIFLYKSNTQIVISDIDGTITKSDVLGQLMPMVGKEWSHEGVADLYNSIKSNGYEILYLTARAIGQSEITRNFIKSLEQEGIKLPEGPVIMSPDRIFKSFKREVIHKKPEIFKIVALRDIQGLFQSQTPFYAGFGNRDTDAIAYKAVGVSMGRIFIINPNGQCFQFNNTYNKTYKELDDMVNVMFPPSNKNEDIVEDRYNGLNYWGSVNHYCNSDIDALLK